MSVVSAFFPLFFFLITVVKKLSKRHDKNKLRYKFNIKAKLAVWVLTCCVVVILNYPTTGIQAYTVNNKTLNQKLTLNLSQVTDVDSVVGTDTDFFLSPEDVSNEEVWKAVADIGIPVLRFPGGQGNFYDWRMGNIQTSVKTRTVPMDAFMSHVRQVGTSVSYVLNITESPQRIRDLASYWKQTNAPVQWVEMGNEYFLFSQAIGGPVGYMQRCTQALQALRAGGFQGPVGIHLAPFDAPGMPRFDYGLYWNEAIAMANTQDFDAIILHYYPWVQTVGFYTDYREGPPVLIKTIKTLREKFPRKQVWVTEWNLGPPVDIPEFNSLVHAMLDLRMLHAMLDSRVNMSCYHVLTGTGWELLGPDRLTLEYSENFGTKMLRRVTFFAFEELLKAQINGAYLEKQMELNGLEYMAFIHNGEVRIVAWSPNGISTSVDLELPGYTTQFLGGEALRGQLLDTNGSLLSKDLDSLPWVEKIVPTPIDTPVLNGPSIVLLRFSVVPSPLSL